MNGFRACVCICVVLCGVMAAGGATATAPATASHPAVASRPVTTASYPAASAPTSAPTSSPTSALTSAPTPTSAPASSPAASVPAASGSAATPTAAERPNILVICLDGMPPSAAGYAGNEAIKTPNLDRIAAESIRFDRAYTATPDGAGGRVSILTGQYSHVHGVTSDKATPSNRALAFSSMLERAGYRCGLVGSWDLPPLPGKSGSAEPGQPAHPGEVPLPTANKPGTPSSAPLDKPGMGFDRCYAVADSGAPFENATVYRDGARITLSKPLPDWFTDEATKFIKEPGASPFCLCVFFHAFSERESGPSIAPATLPLPTIVPHTSKVLGPLTNSDAYRYCPQQKNPLRDKQAKYYSHVVRLDQSIGRLLDALRDAHLDDKTLVVFTAARGFSTGEISLWGTGPIFFEPFVRVPLLVRVPASWPTGAAMRAHRVAQSVSLIDLAPTVLEIAGLSVPPTIQGRSLVPLLRSATDVQRTEECFVETESAGANQQYRARSVVADNFKLVDYFQGSDQFFDLKRDPDETKNSIDDPAYAPMVKVFRARLDQWRKKTWDAAK